jgi:transcriptional regulator with XRE-family HTH domain
MTGDKLKELRDRKGITQLQLANETGVPLGTIGRIESKNEEIKKVEVLNAFKKFFKIEENQDNPNHKPMYKLIESLERTIATQERLINNLEQENDRLRVDNTDLRSVNKTLLEQLNQQSPGMANRQTG